MILCVVGWDLIAANVSAVEYASTSQDFQLFVAALAQGNLVEAERRLGLVGNGGFLGNFATSGGNATLAIATAYENAWHAAVERARRTAEEINRGN